MQYSNLPTQLKEKERWILADNNKVPVMIDGHGQITKIDPASKTLTLYNFDTAVKYATETGMHLGYVLRKGDSLICIDIDIKADTSYNKLLEYRDLIQTMGTYCELSVSGNGIHLWLRGETGAGRRGAGYEVYSQDRYIICTGNSIIGMDIDQTGIEFHRGVIPLTDDNPRARKITDMIIRNMPSSVISSGYRLNDIAPVEANELLLGRISSATSLEHRQKFTELYYGTAVFWGAYGIAPSGRTSAYPSQSEADQALITILCHYTNSDQQVYDLFTKSRMYRKAKDRKYPLRCITRSREMLIKDRQIMGNVNNSIADLVSAWTKEQELTMEPNFALDPTINECLDKFLGIYKSLDSLKKNTLPPALDIEDYVKITQDNGPTYDFTTPQLTDVPVLTNSSVSYYNGQITFDESAYAHPDKASVNWPPGLLGELAKHLFVGSHKSVREMSIAGAVRIVSTLASRAYNIPTQGEGLNVYMVVLGSSGIGKSTLSKSYDRISSQIKDPTLKAQFQDGFIATKLASGNAMFESFKKLSLSVFINEISSLLEEASRGGPRAGVLDLLLEYYDRSGAGTTAGGIQYADSQKNKEINSPVAVSMFADSTPNAYFKQISSKLINDGTVSRIIHLHCESKSPFTNRKRHTELQPAIIARIEDLVRARASNIASFPIDGMGYVPEKREVCIIEWTKECEEAYWDFDNANTVALNKSELDIEKSTLTRAALNAVKLASLCAVMDNPFSPVITLEHFSWAKSILQFSSKCLNKAAETGTMATTHKQKYMQLVTVLDNTLKSNKKIDENVSQRTKEARVLAKYGMIEKRRISMLLRNNQLLSYFSHTGSNISKIINDEIDNAIEAELLTELTGDALEEANNAIALAIGKRSNKKHIYKIDTLLLKIEMGEINER